MNNKLCYQDILNLCVSDIGSVTLFGLAERKKGGKSRKIVLLSGFGFTTISEYLKAVPLGLLYYNVPVNSFRFEKGNFYIYLESDFGIDIDNKFLAVFEAAKNLCKSNQTAVAAAVLMEFEKQNNVSLNKEIIMNFFNEH